MSEHQKTVLERLAKQFRPATWVAEVVENTNVSFDHPR